GLAPLEARLEEDAIEAFLLRLMLHRAGARHHHGVDARRDLAALRDRGGGAQVLDAAVGAGADEDALHRHVREPGAGREAHVVERAGDRRALALVRDIGGVWHHPGDRQHVLGAGAPGVMRPSMERPRMVLPAYSITWPVPPAVPILPMMARIRSLGVTPTGSLPSTRTSMFLAVFWISVWVASTCSTSDVPMPKARQPKAPCVAVWLSPQTTVVPGWVMPCSGPMMCTMPWRISDMP